MKKINIVEYQPDRQRTPKEALEYLQENLEKDKISHLYIIIGTEDGFMGDIPASVNRDYKASEIVYHLEQMKRSYL